MYFVFEIIIIHHHHTALLNEYTRNSVARKHTRTACWNNFVVIVCGVVVLSMYVLVFVVVIVAVQPSYDGRSIFAISGMHSCHKEACTNNKFLFSLLLLRYK